MPRVMVAPADFLPGLALLGAIERLEKPKRRKTFLVERRNFAIDNNSFDRATISTHPAVEGI